MQEKPPYDRMMAYLDGEMTPEQREKFELLVEKHPEWREEMAAMKAIVGATEQMHLKPPDPAVWDNYWEEIDSRLQRRMGWSVALAGALVLIVFGVVKVITFAENNLVRAGIALVVIGLGVLFAAALRARILELPHDRYRRIRK